MTWDWRTLHSSFWAFSYPVCALKMFSNTIQSLSRKCAELAWHLVAVGNAQSACSVSLALESGLWRLLRAQDRAALEKYGWLLNIFFLSFYTLKIFVDWGLNNMLSWLGCSWELCGSSELAAEHLGFCSSKRLFFLPVQLDWNCRYCSLGGWEDFMSAVLVWCLWAVHSLGWLCASVVTAPGQTVSLHASGTSALSFSE